MASDAAEGSPGDGWTLGPPPEGVDWSNRWAELENATVALEAERDSLKFDIVGLRKERLNRAEETLAPKQAPAIDRKEVDQLQERLSAAVNQAEERLKDIVDERTRASKLSEDLQAKTANLANLSKDKLNLQYELNMAKSTLLPVEKERDRFRESLQEAERHSEELREEAAKATEAKNRFFKEKQELKRDLMKQVEEAQADAKFHQNVAEEALEKQAAARNQIADVQRKAREQAEAFAEERASLEKKLELRGEQLERANSLREAGVAQLVETKVALEAAQASEKEAVAVVEEHKARIAKQEEELGELRREHEELLRRRIPGAAALTTPPEGFASVSELVREVTLARADALQAKQEKEQYQDVLLEVEREIRARYPALERQRSEYERLRVVAAQLTRQNEGLLKQVQSSERGQREADSQAKQSKRSAQILEEHAKDMANQLGVLVVKNQRLTGKMPTRPPGCTDLEALEADRKYLHTVQDLAAQNENLKKQVLRLAEECETTAQRELTTERQVHQEQTKAWEEHLGAKAEQMKALAANIERLTHERDTAQRVLSAQAPQLAAIAAPPAAATPPAAASGKSGGSSGGPLLARGDLVPREHLQIVREEFTKSTEALRAEIRELRSSEQLARAELAKAQAKLDCELSASRNYESSKNQLEKRLEERKVRCGELEKHNANLESNLEKEMESARNLEATGRQANRDKSHLDTQLKLERSNVTRLEHSNATLLAEKATHTQHNVDLQSLMTQQVEGNNREQQKLEGAYKKVEEQLKEQLDQAKQREHDMEQTVKDVNAARAEREAEVADSKKRVSELETSVTRLETQVAERNFEIVELRAALPSYLKRGADVAADAEEQLRKAQTPQPKAEDVAKLEQKVRFAEDREKKHAEDKKMWESLIASHEKDLKAGNERMAQLDGELTGLREQQAKHDEVTEKARQKEQQLETQVFDLDNQAKDLKAQMEKRDAEVAAAKLDGEQKVREIRTQLETIEHNTADARDNLQDWQRKHREAVQSHAKDITELDAVKEKSKLDYTEIKELRQKNSDLEVDNQHARKQRIDDLESLKKRAEDAEKHAEALAAESRCYQEKLLAFADQSTGSGPNVDMERIAQEMRRARELSELSRQELEIDKERAERQSKMLQEESAELHRRLDKEQETTHQLQAEIRRQQRGLDKLERLGLLEDENRRLAQVAKSVQERLDETTKELEAQKAQLEPLQLCKREVTRKEEDWERTKKEMDAKADEWKNLYDEMVQRFDSLDVKELKTLREAQVNWNAAKADLTNRLEKTMEDYKKASTEKTTVEEMRKSLTEAQAKVTELATSNRQLAESSQKATTEASRSAGLKDLGTRKINELEGELKSARAELSKGKEMVAKFETEKADHVKRIEKASQDLKEAGAAAQQGLALKAKNEELTKKLSEVEEQVKQAQRLRAQTVETNKKTQDQLKQGEALKQIGLKKIAELEDQLAKKEEEIKKCKAEASSSAGAEAALKKITEKADKAMALAMDYQRGCAAQIAKNTTAMSRNQQLEQQVKQNTASLQAITARATAAVTAAPPAAPAAAAPEAPTSLPAAAAEPVAVSTPSSSSTVGSASNPFSQGGSAAAVLFPASSSQTSGIAAGTPATSPVLPGTGAAKRKLESDPSVPGADMSMGVTSVPATEAPAKTARTEGTPAPLPKKAPAAAKKAPAVAPAAAPAAAAAVAAAVTPAAAEVPVAPDAAADAPLEAQTAAVGEGAGTEADAASTSAPQSGSTPLMTPAAEPEIVDIDDEVMEEAASKDQA